MSVATRFRRGAELLESLSIFTIVVKRKLPDRSDSATRTGSMKAPKE